MNATLLTKKILLSVLFTSTVVITGGIYKTSEIADTSFMNDDEIKFTRRFDDSRYVASAESELKKPKVAVRYLPVNQENKMAIAGKWIVTRIEGHDEVEVYNSQTENREIIVDMELVATSQVRVDNNDDYKFDVSFLHESKKTIALFRSYEDGYEILEARRLYNEEKEQVAELSESLSENELEKREATVRESDATLGELILERALVPSVDPNIIVFKEMSANTAEISTTSITSWNVTVAKNGKSETFEGFSGAEIGAGGSIMVPVGNLAPEVSEKIIGQSDEPVDMVPVGLVTNNGKDGLRVRLTVEPYVGVMLSFVTPEEFRRIKEEEYEVKNLREQNAYENGTEGATQVEEEQNEAQVDSAALRAEAQEELEYERQRDIEAMREEMRMEIEAEIREGMDYYEEYNDEVIDAEPITNSEEMTETVKRIGYSF